MKTFTQYIAVSVAILKLLIFHTASGQPSLSRFSEDKGRGLVAIAHPEGGVYLSWRLFHSDVATTTFDLYRLTDGQPTKLNDTPLQTTTDYHDEAGQLSAHDWYVVASNNPRPSALALKGAAGGSFLAFATGSSTHGRNFAVGAFQRPGALDMVLKHTTETIDPYYSNWRPSTSTYHLNAFDMTGQLLWTYDMGPAIETGIWYAPFAVYDLDGDGQSELIVKAGDETMSADELRDESGRVTNGPEYLRVISGQDGNTVLAQADWPSREGFTRADAPGTPLADRKYEDYNRYSRNFIAIAYLDGHTPHVVVSRGTYGKHKTQAFRYTNGSLELVWSWENVDPAEGGDRAYWGQGAHAIQAHDVDADGKDEVVLGAIVLDDDGQPLYSLGVGHVDHVYIADILPERPGKELYYGLEWAADEGGMGLCDAANGERIWGADFPTTHIHREGLVADLDASRSGLEMYSGEQDESATFLWQSDGVLISQEDLGGLRPLSLHWDADEQEELWQPNADHTVAVLGSFHNYPTMESVSVLPVPDDTDIDDRQNLRVLAVLDLLGDWRDELIVADRGRLLVYTTTIGAESRKAWALQDHTYAMGVVNSSQGYYQTPMSNTARVSSLALAHDQVSMTVGEVVQAELRVRPQNAVNRCVIWSSGDSSVARVEGAGRISARAPGTTTITATAIDGNLTATLEVTVLEAAEDTVTDTDSAGPVLATEDPTMKNTVRVWPNPTNRMLYVAGIRGRCTVKILSLEGKVVRETTLYAEKKMDVSTLTEGIYMLSITSRSGVWNQKIVIATP